MFKSKLIVLLVLPFVTSCASIVSKSSYNVRLDSSPSDAKVQVLDKTGREIFSGATPTQVVLKSGAGYFSKAMYTVRYTKEGYMPKEVFINADINGWYFGNIIFGGLIGLLIVDPITGAMYKLDRTELNETLAAENKSGAVSEKTLKIMEVSQVPESMKEHLVLIK